MVTKESILDKHLEILIGKEKNYESLDKMKETPEYQIVLKAMDEYNAEARRLMQWFVDRCEKGEVRSKRTYKAFKDFLKKK